MMTIGEGTMGSALGTGRSALSEALPVGYKRTEVGVIPQDWKVRTLGALGEFKNGINKDKQDFGHGFPFVNLMDVFGIPKITTSSSIGLVNSSLGERGTYALQRGDVLFVRSSVKPEGVGLTTLISEDLPNTVFSGFLIRYRDNGSFEVEFKEHCFQEAGFRNRLIASSTVSANTNVSQGALKSIKFTYPPNKSEQRAIAEALSDVDGLIGSLERLIAKKRAIKQAAMQEFLTGKTRLPGFSGAWETRRLGNIAPLQRGFDLPTSQIRPGSYAVVYSNGVLHRHERAMATGPGVVTGRSGTIGKVHFIEKDYWPHNTSLWVTSFCGNDPKFVYYFYTHLDLTRFLSGSGVPTLNRNDVHQHLASCPSLPEQRAIATILSDMDAEIAALERRRDKTRAIKQGMMQQLLTGRVRLVEPE